ncbi:endo-1,4-beta-xylanase [Silvibacterium acidisoli]|uniref:endo-1,4-beta-xylanase n=1 Tax=Acidobacteriaceae bacterium ZG23-2 TaxID=2883246 RepID=UPI00406BF4F1
MNRRRFLQVSAAAAACSLQGFAEKKHKAAAPSLTDVTGERSLRAHAEARGLLVGCAVVPEHLDGETDYAATVAAQSNILVPENAMKWQALRPAADRFDFRAADEILMFAEGHGQKLRGHNLCWHEALPSWFESTVNADNARRFLTEHIQTVAGRYAGKLHSWDVVNEAIDIHSGRADGLRKSPWLEFLGPGYLEIAFQAAKQADPNALLTYNDYGIETDAPDQTEKRAQVLMLVRRLVARRVPIDAVGVQSHLAAGDKPGAGLRDFVRELGRMGLQVFVTEMDVNEQKLEGSVAERDAGVAELYKDYLTMMLAEPNVTAVLTWGITDRYTWLNSDQKHLRPDGKPQRPLPFDSDYQPAPAYFAMRDALDSRAGKEGAPVKSSPDADPYAPFTPKGAAPKLMRQ